MCVESVKSMKPFNFTLAGKVTLSVAALILGIGLMIASIWAYGWLVWVGVIVILVTLLLNSLVQVEAEEAGIQKIFGKASSRVLMPGLNLIWPFITKIIMVNTKKNSYPHVEEGIDPADGFKLSVSYVVLAKLNPQNLWRFASGYNLPIDTNYTIDFMQKILRDVCVVYTCDQLRTDASCRATVQNEVHSRFMDMVNEKLDISLFDEIDVIVKDYAYLPDYLALVKSVKEAEKEAEAAVQKKKATEILAEAKKAAILASGEAENAVLEHLGEILKAHPEININELAKHFPQYFGGGVMPTINMEEMLNGKPKPTIITP